MSRLALCLVTALILGVTAHAQTFRVLHAFGANSTDGAVPESSLLLHAGSLYGTTSQTAAPGSGGTVFAINARTGQETVLYRFGGIPNDGAGPVTGVVRDPAGIFYGTTFGGGLANDGTLFRLDSGVESVLVNFGSAGAEPMSTLLRGAVGNLYGSTSLDGRYGGGTLFKLDAGGTYTTLYNFGGNGVDAFSPRADMLLLNGRLYGTTYDGGAGNLGTVFSFDLGANQLTVLHSFLGKPGGRGPMGGLVTDGHGNLYGATTGGGVPCTSSLGCGTVFALHVDTGKMTILHSFDSVDGLLPVGNLVRDTQGNLYGVTQLGGASGFGVLYKLDPAGNLTVLHNFTGGMDGANPKAGLTADTLGNLYGTTARGGAHHVGVLFRLTP